MKNYMLMNGAVSPQTEHEEFRVAILKGPKGKLHNFFVDSLGQEQKKSNIYKGILTRIEPSLEAVFVDYGTEKHGFLPFKEISEVFLKPQSEGQHYSIKDRLTLGQELMIQIDKDERGSKGAALTTFISLAGCYLVLMPNNPQAGGISRRIEGENRENLKENLSALEIPNSMGLIIRTAGVGKNLEELKWDLSILLKHWEAIWEAYQSRSGPFLIHQESNIIVRAIRDYMREDIHEILVDNPEVFGQVQNYVQQVRPDFLPRVKLYQSHVPLFSRFQIESQIEAAFQHEVRLPSGGAIVIVHTEALVSIDVNSSRSTKGGDIEETALTTNLEAADEIARQLRLRDTGGLIVIDFIDMHSGRHPGEPSPQRKVEDRLRTALEADRARVQIGRISRFGLLEMSRQRLRTSLGETAEITCPRCSGHGSVRTISSLTLSIIRLIEEEALKEDTREIRVHLPVDVATFLLNEKRDTLQNIEKRHEARIWVLPNPQLTSPHYKIERIKETAPKTTSKSYELSENKHPDQLPFYDRKEKRHIEEPAVKSVPISQPHPIIAQISESSKKSLLTRLIDSLFGDKPEKNEELTKDEKSEIPSSPVKSQDAHNIASHHRDQKFKNQSHRNKKNHRMKSRRFQKNPKPYPPTEISTSHEAVISLPHEKSVTPQTTASVSTAKNLHPPSQEATEYHHQPSSSSPEQHQNNDFSTRPYGHHKRRGRHLRRGGGGNFRHKQDNPPDEKS